VTIAPVIAILRAGADGAFAPSSISSRAPTASRST
jgi:hypothetical protein